MLRRLIVLGAGLLAAAPLQAELRWNQPVQEFHRSPQDKYVEATYTFKNTGSQPIAIENVRTSCGCTSADPDKKSYAPGDTGEIKVKFTFGGRLGGQRKTIRVFTSDKGNEPTLLDLRVFIEEPLKLTPALVFWRKGDSPNPKVIQIKSTPERPVHIKDVRSSNPAFAATLQTVKTGEEYTVTVTPGVVDSRQSGEISIATDYPPDAPRTYKVHARVK